MWREADRAWEGRVGRIAEVMYAAKERCRRCDGGVAGD